VKYDDAAWHFGGNFPKASPQAYGGTHIALFLRWCFLKGWAGDLHIAENANDVERMKRGDKPATEFLFQWCDGKFTNEDLNSEGNEFAAVYYGKDGAFLGDYANTFAHLLYVADEKQHDFEAFSNMVNRRYDAYVNQRKRPWWKPW